MRDVNKGVIENSILSVSSNPYQCGVDHQKSDEHKSNRQNFEPEVRDESANRVEHRWDKELEDFTLVEQPPQVELNSCLESAIADTTHKINPSQLLRCGRKYECHLCGKRFRKPCLLQRHAVVHTTEKPFQCTTCSKCFTQKSSLQRHLKHNHLCQKSHKCAKCDKCFSQKSNLLTHLMRAHAVSSGVNYCAANYFACDRCSCVYSKLNSLNRHKSQYHTAVESEAARAAHLAFKYQDETPVVDADELARSVLVEIKKLQGGMMASVQPAEIEQHEGVKPKQLSSNETLTETLISATQTLVDNPGKIHLVNVCDKLNPQFEPHTITVQCIRRSDGIAYYVCEFCAKEFRKTYDLIRHRRTHSQENPYNCLLCNKCCKTKSKLEEHKRVHITIDASLPCNRYICRICQQVFDSIRQLDTHASSHAKTHSLLYACSVCGRSYGSVGAFMKHRHREQDTELKMISSLLPNAIEVSTKTVQQVGSGSDCSTYPKMQTALQCNTCERLFATKNLLNLHHKIHSTHKQFICPICTCKKFPTASRLRRHMLSHTNQRNFKCAYCIKTYKSRAHCRQHMLVHLKTLLKDANAEPVLSSDLKPKECLVVVQQNAPEVVATETQPSLPPTPKFIELQMLPKYRRHKQHKNITIKTISAATNTEVNSCSFCQRQFKKPNDLQRHLRTHTKERPYKCNLCTKAFALQSTLKEHCLTHASQRNTYDCQVCGKSYASKKVLVLHLRIHTGERPFKCQYCEQTFRTSGHRQAHNRAAHKQQYTTES